MAFRQLREVFNIEAAEYMKSICGAQLSPHQACVHLWCQSTSLATHAA